MAITRAARGTGTHNTGAASFTLSPSGNFGASSWAVLCVAADNSASGGSTNDFTTVTDSIGNTWTKRRSPVFDNGAASAGVQGAIWTCAQDVGPLQTGTVITVSFGSSPVAKTWTLDEVIPTSGSSIIYVEGADDPGATTAAPTLTTVSIVSGNIVVAAYFVEAGTTQTGTGDADTTNGSWSTAQYAEIGSTTSGSVIISQTKIVTATGAQTFNPTLGISSDTVGAYVVLSELVDVTGSGGVDIDAPAVAGSGVERFTGTGAPNIDAPAAAATGTETFTGTGSPNIDAPAVTGSGTSTDPGVTGTGAVDIDAPGVTGSGLERLTGTGAVSIDAPSVTASGLERFTGSGAVSIDAPTVTGTGVERVTGSGAVSIDAPAIEGFGAPPSVTGTGAVSIAAPSVAGAGGLHIGGTGALDIDAPSIAGAGIVRLTGSGSVTIAAPGVAGLGSLRITGSGGVTIAPPGVTGGSVAPVGTGPGPSSIRLSWSRPSGTAGGVRPGSGSAAE